MPRPLFTLSCAVALACCGQQRACAQIKAAPHDALVRYGHTEVTRFRVGASVTAKRGAVRDVLATVAIPLTCPEQEVELVEEDISDYVRSHDYRLLQDGGAQQMLMRVPQLPNKAEAHAILTFEVRTRTILPPLDTAALVIPQKPPRELKRFLGKSPLIETNNSKLKKLVREIFAQRETPAAPVDDTPGGTDREGGSEAAQEATRPPAAGEATVGTAIGAAPPAAAPAAVAPQPAPAPPAITDWQRVEAIYDWVQDNIQYVEGPDKSALATLKAGQGDCQNISALFVALCRTGKIPARIVWVHEHNYPEFCLADAAGNLHWFPCESSGTRAFGEMPLARVIMQKGDNFRVPERKKALRYVSDYMIGVPAAAGGGPPSHKFIREQL